MTAQPKKGLTSNFAAVRWRGGWLAEVAGVLISQILQEKYQCYPNISSMVKCMTLFEEFIEFERRDAQRQIIQAGLVRGPTELLTLNFDRFDLMIDRIKNTVTIIDVLSLGDPPYEQVVRMEDFLRALDLKL
ncbi:hypothetical protein [Dongia sp.]|uniref:hypothetical protein n=1 Tax=Dongia sp. TaxID=1977262 RepID=UPI0035B13F94